MKQISNEAKARYFAQYLGQEKSGVFDAPGRLTGTDCDQMRYGYDTITKLLLRPLSSLTQEEVIQIAHLLIDEQQTMLIHSKLLDSVFVFEDDCSKTGYTYLEFHLTGGIDVGNIDINNVQNRDSMECASESILNTYQYLQQIGVALPYYDASTNTHYTVDDLVELGVVKLI